MREQPLLFVLMAISSATESAMYAFVLEWTPALTTPSTRPPYGLIFSCFMVAYMAGSTTFALFLRNGVRPATALVIFMASSVFAIGGAWLFFKLGINATPGGTFSVFLLLTLFEFNIGGYFATMATLKAEFVPEPIRATIYNVFRVPLNLIVVVINLVSLSSEFTFFACTILLTIAFGCSIVARHMVVHIEGKATPLV